jgi:hypothetical protein
VHVQHQGPAHVRPGGRHGGHGAHGGGGGAARKGHTSLGGLRLQPRKYGGQPPRQLWANNGHRAQHQPQQHHHQQQQQHSQHRQPRGGKGGAGGPRGRSQNPSWQGRTTSGADDAKKRKRDDSSGGGKRSIQFRAKKR